MLESVYRPVTSPVTVRAVSVPGETIDGMTTDPIRTFITYHPGWARLVTELDAALRAIAPDIRYLDIKEKFGALRVYTTHDSNPAVQMLTDDAERRFETLCESCDAAGTLHKSRMGWYRTLCPTCAAEREHTKAESPRE